MIWALHENLSHSVCNRNNFSFSFLKEMWKKIPIPAQQNTLLTGMKDSSGFAILFSFSFINSQVSNHLVWRRKTCSDVESELENYCGRFKFKTSRSSSTRQNSLGTVNLILFFVIRFRWKEWNQTLSINQPIPSTEELSFFFPFCANRFNWFHNFLNFVSISDLFCFFLVLFS